MTIDDRARLSMGPFDLTCYIEALAVGLSGGLVAFCDPSVILVDSLSDGRSWISIKGTVVGSSKKVSIYNVLVPHQPHEKDEFNLSLGNGINGGEKDTMGKLRLIKSHVKTWNKYVNGDIHQKIGELEQQQFQLDEEEASDVTCNEISFKLHDLYLERAKMLSQKAMTIWKFEEAILGSYSCIGSSSAS
ncbi:hypothetical protein AgCh_032553 [Apium graveolens]